MKNSLVISSITLMGIRALGVGVQLATTIFLARNLTLLEMGQFALMYAALGLVRAIGSFGVDQASMRQIAGTMDGRRVSTVAQKLSLAGIVIAMASGILISICVLCAQKLGLLGAQNATLFAMAAPAYVLIGLLVGQVRGLGHNLAAQVPESIGLQLFIFLGLMPAYLNGTLNGNDTLHALLWAGWLTLAIQILIRFFIGGGPIGSVDRASFKVLLSDGWSIFQAQIFTVLAMRAPIFLGTALLGAGGTAIIEVALRFGTLPSLLTSSVGATFSPAYARLSKDNNILGLNKARKQAGLLAGIPSFVYVLFCTLGGGVLIGWAFPASYSAAVLPISLIAFGSFVNAAFGPASNVFLMSGQAKIVRKYSILRLICVVAVSFLAGPIWGSVGIAIAILLGFALRDIGLSLVARRKGF
ncbi:lipopolysaccharide biosynthesis protein [Falsihalocynthiibacter sp. BN13B15]|uniref:lipopolysaccharide biosynthesis protein n=1 Tax=Falsihalocynthiibacter sp. BN13B15 TaxID=3240871 RepID=UPI00350F0ECB